MLALSRCECQDYGGCVGRHVNNRAECLTRMAISTRCWTPLRPRARYPAPYRRTQHETSRRARPARFSVSHRPNEGRAGGRKAGRFSVMGGLPAARARRYFGSPPLRLSLASHHARTRTGSTSGPGHSIPGGAAACPLRAGALLPPRGWTRLLRSTERQSHCPCPRGFLRRRFLLAG